MNPADLLSSAASAGAGQWRERPPEWKQGAAGYGFRFGSAYAEHVIRETLMFGTSSLLHEDNRYFRCPDTSCKKRLTYALKSTFLARQDDGSRHISVSKIGSFAGAAFISRAWQQPSSRSVHSGEANFGISMAVAAGFDVVHEFLPDLLHRR